jgi:hypothetical protein
MPRSWALSPRSDHESSQSSPPLWPWCAEPAAGPAAQWLPQDPLVPGACRRFLGRYFETSRCSLVWLVASDGSISTAMAAKPRATPSRAALKADRARVDMVNSSLATEKRPRGEQGCRPRQLRRARLFAGAEFPVAQLAYPVTAKCPEPLCPNSALPSWGRRLAPSRKVLPFLPRSYGLMRQTFTLLPISGYALIRKVFAGCCQPLLRKGSSQRYRCRPSLRAGTPTPAAPKVLSPVSSPGTLAFPERTRVGAWLRSTSATSDGEDFGAAVIPLRSGPQVCSPHR